MTNNNIEGVNTQASYKGFSLFNEVENVALRTWNRCVVALNINADNGKDLCSQYLNQLDKVSKLQVMAMLQYIKARGAEETLKEIRSGEHTPISQSKSVH